MSFRKIIFWFHLIIGVITAIIVFLMSFTGVLLTYEKQMIANADRKLYNIQPSDSTVPLSAEELLIKFREVRSEVNPSSLTITSDSEMPPVITSFPAGQTYINPYTGEILGTGAQGIRKFFRLMTDLHRWLALSGESRGTGRSITGICNLGFLLILISGIYLWLPRKWTRNAVRYSTWFKPGLSSKARDSNWHYTFGFWSTVPLIFIVISAVVISYPWASDLVFKITGSEVIFKGRPRRGPVEGPMPALDINGINSMLTKLKSGTDIYKTISIKIPTVDDQTVSFTVNRGLEGQPQHRSTVTFDKKSHEIVKTEEFKDMDPGIRARFWMRFVHTGEYYGFAGQTIAGIASISAVMLTWTGIALSWRRYFRWMRRR